MSTTVTTSSDLSISAIRVPLVEFDHRDTVHATSRTVFDGVLVVAAKPSHGYPYIALTYAYGEFGVGTYLLTPGDALRLADALDWHAAVAAGDADPLGQRPAGCQVRDIGGGTAVSRVDLHAPYLAQVRLATPHGPRRGPHEPASVLWAGPGPLALTADASADLAAALRDHCRDGVAAAVRQHDDGAPLADA